MLKTESEKPAGREASVVEHLVMCRWWELHKYTKWVDLNEYKNISNQPVLVQEKRCVICNHSVRRTSLIDAGT